MKRIISLITIICLIVVVLGFFMYHRDTKIKYDELTGRFSTPLLQVQNIGSNEQDFINNVIVSWHKHREECPCEILTEISKISGYSNNVDGLVKFANHKIRDYSYFDSDQNKQEIAISIALANKMSMSKDHKIYYKNGLAYLRINDNVIEIYEDTESGARNSLYIKEKKRGANH